MRSRPSPRSTAWISTNDEFRALVRGAFTVQQEQIDGLRKTVEQLAHGWQAYLRTIHPPQ